MNADEMWHPTMRLRFVERQAGPGTNRVLQQSWRNVSTNESEWRDVPLEDEV